MKYFLVHLGSPFPKYVTHCVNQIYKHDNQAEVLLCGDIYPEFINNKFNFVNANELDLPSFDYLKDDPCPLWHTALMRVFVINAFMQKTGTEGLIHFDNDVMIFGDFNKIKKNFNRKNYITPHKKTEYTFGFSYLNNKEEFNALTNEIYKTVLLGERKVRQLTGDEAHEMRLLGYCANNLIEDLPVHPSMGSIENCIFDPSSWGQYAGGTPDGFSPGFIDPKQLVGSILTENKETPVLLYKPETDTYHLKYDNDVYQVFNLHIHSKKLQLFEKWEKK